MEFILGVSEREEQPEKSEKLHGAVQSIRKECGEALKKLQLVSRPCERLMNVVEVKVNRRSSNPKRVVDVEVGASFANAT